MAQYKVVVEFELDGVVQPVDSVVELSDEAASQLVTDGKVVAVEAAPESTPETPEVAPEA